MEVNNVKSLRQFMEEEKSNLQIIDNTATGGKIFFSCGSKTGVIGKSLVPTLDTEDLNNISYADITSDDGVVFPTLFIKNNKNVRRTFTL